MNNYTDFVDMTLSDFKASGENPELYEEFEAERKNQMRNRELQLRKRGLSDDTVISDLIISENLDIRNDITALFGKAKAEKREKQRMIIKFLMAAAYFMVIGIGFILDSFYNHDWGHSWLIIVGGIIIFAIILFLMPPKFHYKGRRFFPLTVCLMISSLLAAFYIFLILISFHIPHSYLVIPSTLTAITLIDALVPAFKRHKFAILHSLISLPLFATSLYLTLALMGFIPWQTGWLLIIAALVCDILILVWAFTKKSRLAKEEEDYHG